MLSFLKATKNEIVRWFALILCSYTSFIFGQDLVVDLTEGGYRTFADVNSFIEFNGDIFWSFSDPDYGYELWRTRNGHTTLIKDINPGSDSSDIYGFVKTSGFFFFLANDGQDRQLWQSDGTPEGTQSLSTLSGGSLPTDEGQRILGVFQDHCVFASWQFPDSYTHTKLYITDGTPDGMTLLKDFSLEEGSMDEATWRVLDDLFYFEASTAQAGRELWRSDGTSQGTMILDDFSPGPDSSSYSSVVRYDGQTYFLLKQTESLSKLMVTDGTVQTTHVVSDLMGPSVGEELLVTSNGLFFKNYTTETGWELWISDGTAQGTELLLDFLPGSQSSYSTLYKSNGDLAFFMGWTEETSSEMWVTDGSIAGTKLLRDFTPGSSGSTFSLRKMLGGVFYFVVNHELWCTDGTEQGTNYLTRLSSSNDVLMAPYFEQVFLAMTVYSGGYSRYGLWTYDGNELLVRDNWYPIEGRDTNFGELFHFKDHFFFTTRQTDDQVTLHETAGDPWNTIPLMENLLATQFTPIEQNIFFVNDTAEWGPELWVYDGNIDSMRLVKDVSPSNSYNTVRHIEPFGPKALFCTSTDLYITDGEEMNTFLLQSFESIDLGSSCYNETTGITLFFASGDNGSGLYRTDGTVEGTFFVKQIQLDGLEYNAHQITSRGRFFYFVGRDPDYGDEIWRTDGIPQNTVKLTSFNETLLGYSDAQPLFFGEDLFVLLFSDLYKVNPDTGSTELFHGFDQSSGSSELYKKKIFDLGGCIVLRVRGDLWTTDGTQGGTYRVHHSDSGLKNLTVHQNFLYFSAKDSNLGWELWVSDGSAPGTHLVQDLNPGLRSSNPKNLTTAGSYLFFSAETREMGRELWRICHSPDTQIRAEQVVCSNATQNSATISYSGPGSSYFWTVDGGTIQAGEGTPAIAFKADTLEPVSIYVDVATSMGCSNQGVTTVEVQSLIPDQPGPISGDSFFCQNGDPVAYDIEPVDNATTYLWSVPNGAQILQGQGSTDVLIRFGPQTGVVSVNAVNSCGQSTPSSLFVDFAVTPNVADAGEDQALCGSVTNLNGNAPGPGTQGVWSIIDGFGGTVVDPNDPQSEFLGVPDETYRLQWTISQTPCVPSFDQVIVQFFAPVQPPFAGEDQITCGGSTYLEAVQPEIGIGEWAILDGPLGATIHEPHNPQSRFEGEGGATYTLRWTVNNGVCQELYDDVVITANLYVPSNASAGDDQYLSVIEQAQLTADFETGWEGTWSVSQGPSTLDEQFSNIHDPYAIFTPMGGVGEYRLDWRVSSPPCTIERYDSLSLFFAHQNFAFQPIIDSNGYPVEGFLNFTSNDDGSFLFKRKHDDPPPVGEEIWRVDESDYMARFVEDLNPGINSSIPSEFMHGLDRTFFVESNTFTLWTTDGTQQGTTEIAHVGTSGTDLSYTTLNQQIFFAGDSWPMWKTDGTTNGTSSVDAGIGFTKVKKIIEHNGELYFIGRGEGFFDFHIYRSDGTEAGTTVITPENLTPHDLISVGNFVYFIGETDAHGKELWVTNGTLGSTHILQDFSPGAGDSDLDLWFINDRLLINHGHNLYVSQNGQVPTLLDSSISARDYIPKVVKDGELYFSGYDNAGAPSSGIYKTNGATIENVHDQIIFASESAVLGSFIFYLENESSNRIKRLNTTNGVLESVCSWSERFGINAMAASGQTLFINARLNGKNQMYCLPVTSARQRPQIRAPEFGCANTLLQFVELDHVVPGSEIQWEIINGSLESGQGTTLPTVRVEPGVATILTARIREPESEEWYRYHRIIPLAGNSFVFWNTLEGVDLNHNGISQIDDLIQSQNGCGHD